MTPLMVLFGILLVGAVPVIMMALVGAPNGRIGRARALRAALAVICVPLGAAIGAVAGSRAGVEIGSLKLGQETGLEWGTFGRLVYMFFGGLAGLIGGALIALVGALRWVARTRD